MQEPIASLTLDPNNANDHPQANLEAIKEQLGLMGQLKPIVATEDRIVRAGNGTLMAAREMGATHIAVVFIPAELEPYAEQFALAYNQTTRLSKWNPQRLKEALERLKASSINPKGLGFEPLEIRKLLARLKPQADRDLNDTDIKVTKRAKAGDLWRLGDHLLYCGDSLAPEGVERMMDAAGLKQVTMAFTDPPYNVDYGASKNVKHVAGKIANDKLDTTDWKDFNAALIAQLKRWVSGDLYVWGAPGPEGMRQRLWLAEAGAKWSATIIWRKSSLVIGPANYQRIYEPCFYGWFKKSSFTAGRDQVEVWDFNKPTSSPYHPTMKPVELACKGIENSSSDGEAVLDLFGGSGTTLLACEQLGRRCLMAELDTRYCDVILARWEAQSGKKAEKLD